MIGKSYIAPMWAFGYEQSRWGYKNEQDIRDVAAQYKSAGIPLETIYLDIDYMERYKDFTVDKERFPDFKKLTSDMKKQGIHIILDGVFSHTGDDSIYFNRKGRYKSLGAYNSPESQYYKWYKFTEYPDKYQSWWGFLTLPEVIEEVSEYREFINGEGGIIEKWLTAGADGFRLDVADELPDVFIDELRARLKKTKPQALLMGEVWEDATTKRSYGNRRRYLLGDQFDSVMNYPFANAVIDFCRSGKAEAFMDTVMRIVENYPKQCLDVMMNHIGTHDTERAITKMAGKSCEYRDREWQSANSLDEEAYKKGVKLLKCAVALQYTLPGVPSIYYGSEFGIEGRKEQGSDASLRPALDFENYKDAIETNPCTKLIATLGRIRQNTPALCYGDYKELELQTTHFAYERSLDGKSVIVTVNNADNEVYMHLSCSAEAEYVGALSGERVSVNDGRIQVRVPANSGEIWMPCSLYAEETVPEKPRSLLEFVEPYYADKDIMHNMWHIGLVKKMVSKILSSSSYEVDEDCLELATYFHGFIYRDEDKIRQWMQEQGYDEEMISKTVKIAWESQRSEVPETIEGKILHDAHVLEGGKTYVVVKTLITGSVRGQALLDTLDFMEKNVLDKNMCYLPETIPLCEEMNKYTNSFFEELTKEIR